MFLVKHFRNFISTALISKIMFVKLAQHLLAHSISVPALTCVLLQLEKLMTFESFPSKKSSQELITKSL